MRTWRETRDAADRERSRADALERLLLAVLDGDRTRVELAVKRLVRLRAVPGRLEVP